MRILVIGGRDREKGTRGGGGEQTEHSTGRERSMYPRSVVDMNSCQYAWLMWLVFSCVACVVCTLCLKYLDACIAMEMVGALRMKGLSVHCCDFLLLFSLYKFCAVFFFGSSLTTRTRRIFSDALTSRRSCCWRPLTHAMRRVRLAVMWSIQHVPFW